MPKEVIVRLLSPNKERKVNFTIVTKGNVFSEPGEVFNPNGPGLDNTSAERAWNKSRFIVVDEAGNRTYCVPGDAAPAKRHWNLGWGFALAIEESVKTGNLVSARIAPHTTLKPTEIGKSWSFGESTELNHVREVISTSAQHIEIAHKPGIPQLNNFSFHELEADLVAANFGTSLHAITRQVLKMSIEV